MGHVVAAAAVGWTMDLGEDERGGNNLEELSKPKLVGKKGVWRENFPGCDCWKGRRNEARSGVVNRKGEADSLHPFFFPASFLS